MLGGEQGLAEVTFVGEDAALARDGGVEGGVAGGEEGGSFIDEEGAAGAEFEGAGEEGVVVAVGTEGNGVAFGAVVEGLLDAGGVKLLLIGFGERGVELGGEGGADRRNGGFGDLAGVLRVESSCVGECGEEDEGADWSLLDWSDQW